jgi:hypothetical protein
METFLNILWLLIAAGVLAVWRARWVHQRREQRHTRRNSSQEWTAVGCALVLLFFAVSLTDDLHFEMVLFDECATGRRSTVGSCSHDAPHGRTTVHAPATYDFKPVASPDRLRVIGIVLPFVFAEDANGEFVAPSGRAPPSISL